MTRTLSGTTTSTQLAAARKLPADDRESLLTILTTARDACPLCHDIPDRPVVGRCGHIFCHQCILAELPASGDVGGSCPTCASDMKTSDVFPAAALRLDIAGSVQRSVEDTPWISSSKIDRLLELLESVVEKNKGNSGCRPQPKTANIVASRSTSDRILSSAFRKLPDPRSSLFHGSVPLPDKVLVFSQWTSMLDLIEVPLKRRKMKYRRLDGQMTLQQRETAISHFKTEADVIVMLVSLRAAGVGLNLSAANHVVFMDLWWNPTVEEQAIDRVHRIGQTRPVQVTRLMVEDTVEEGIWELQEKKRAVAESALRAGAGGSGDSGHVTLEDLRSLFELT